MDQAIFRHDSDGVDHDSAWLRRSGKHPDLIVWPESPAPFYTTDPCFAKAQQHRSEAQTWVLVGSLGIRNAAQHATALPNSTTPEPGQSRAASGSRYDKMHLVPFGEYVPFKRVFGFAGGLTKEVGDFSPGNFAGAAAGRRTSSAYSSATNPSSPMKSANWPPTAPQVFVNISNDGWYGDSGAYAQHLKQARMRAVENDRWLLRDTNTGVTASIDPYGRVVASHSAQDPRRARRPLRPHQRNHVLHPSRRLVRLSVCDNFCSGAAAALPIPRKDRALIMNEELEQEYTV